MKKKCYTNVIQWFNAEVCLKVWDDISTEYWSSTQTLTGENMLRLTYGQNWKKGKMIFTFFLKCVCCLSLCFSFHFLAPITPTPLQGFLKTISCLSNENNSFSPLLPSLHIPLSCTLSPSLIPCTLWHPCHERDEERERQITPLSWNDPVKCHCYTHTHTQLAFDFLQFNDVSHSQNY